ncbi:rod shape-determining protein MreD [Achromobacter sp. MFA1 R4]|nr:rod shape-determining protein MreD [Achromobacter sp. MFA1 R4]SIT21716.1 rod shape-determining protein MreD [Achromobacter sp. MFA1 R4]
MDRSNQQAAGQSARRLGTPSNVHPDRLSGPAHAVFVWGTVLLAWLVSLLPWRLWQGAPDVLLLIIAFWCVHEPRRVGLFTAFFFGLLMDVHDAGLLGEHALSYTLVAYGAVVLHRRLQRFDLWSQAMHMLPVFFIARFLTQIIHAWLAGKWPGWEWGISVLLTTALWPLAGWVLHLPQRGVDDAESSSA